MFGGRGGGGGDDDEEIDHYEEIGRLLLEGGYFRAQISTLQPFDKMVGGLAWAITLINLDVDLSLDEQATLGQKIKLAEAVCRVLKRMRCPVPLMAHQIQGKDYPQIYTVVKWILEKVVVARAQNEAAVRRYSETQFSTDYVSPEDAEVLKYKDAVDGYVVKVREEYKARRKAKRAGDHSDRSEITAVRGALIEYGVNLQELLVQKSAEELEDESKGRRGRGSSAIGAAAASLDKALGGKGKAAGGGSANEEEWLRKQAADQAKLAALQDALADTKTGEQMSISNSNLRAVIGLQSDDIREISAAFKDKASDLDEMRKASQSGQKEAHRRAVMALEKKVSANSKKVKSSKAKRGAVEATMAEKQAELAKAHKYNEKAKKQTAKLEKQEAEADQGVLDSLKRLVTLNERLKTQESDFKAGCKSQMKYLKNLCAGMGDAALSPEDDEKIKKITALHEKETDKYNKLKEAVAAKSRAIMLIQRKIDDVPTRQELLQFERRFTELYDQVQNKQEETRRHYQTYNTLNDTIEYANKEIEILESMHKQIAEQGVLKNSAYADAFKMSMDRTLQGVVSMLCKKVDASSSTVEQKAGLDTKLVAEVDKQRKHFKAVKDFQEECIKNEKLLKQVPPEMMEKKEKKEKKTKKSAAA